MKNKNLSQLKKKKIRKETANRFANFPIQVFLRNIYIIITGLAFNIYNYMRLSFNENNAYKYIIVKRVNIFKLSIDQRFK